MEVGNGYKIYKAKLNFVEPLQPLTEVTKLIIHHTEETGWDVMTTHKYHQNKKKWSGIGYNYFIESSNGQDCVIYEARGLHKGAHTYGYNHNTLGICISGNFDFVSPTKEQLQALVWICLKLMKQFMLLPEDVLGHREIGSEKTCPGKLFNMSEIRHLLVGHKG